MQGWELMYCGTAPEHDDALLEAYHASLTANGGATGWELIRSYTTGQLRRDYLLGVFLCFPQRFFGIVAD